MDTRRAGAAALTAVAVLLLMASGATAQTYSADVKITKAQSTPGWTHAKIAGSVTFTCTPDSACGNWQPYIEVAPTAFGEGPDCDSNLKLVWEGAVQTANGTQSFSLPRVPIVTEKGIGMYPQHWCFSVNLSDPTCSSPLVSECNSGGLVRSGDLKGRSPCKGGPKKNRFAQAAAQLNVRQYRKKHCPRR